MYYALPYILLLFLLFVLALTYPYLNATLRRRIWMPVAFLLVVFFALRAYIGDDWQGYHPMFIFVKPSDLHLNVFQQHSFRFEPVLAALAYLCRLIFGNNAYLVFQNITALIEIALLIPFLKRYSRNLPFSMIIFLVMGGFIMFINTLRNTVSLLILFHALPFILQRRPLPYFLLCALATLCHISSILFFPLYFFFHRPFNRYFFLVLFFIGNAIVFFQIPILSSLVALLSTVTDNKFVFMLHAYLNDETMNRLQFTISIGTLERCGTSLLFFLLWKRLLAVNPDRVLFLNAFVLYFFFYTFFSEVREVGHRLGDLFIFSYWVLWPDVLYCLRRRAIKLLFAAFLCLYCPLKTVGTLGYPNTLYENVLTGFTPFHQRLRRAVDDRNAMNDALNSKK